jgi:hypothetical protein
VTVLVALTKDCVFHSEEHNQHPVSLFSF